MRRPRGVTLLELSLSIMLVGILMGGVFSLLQSHRRTLVAARDNNLAFFLLEGIRNRLLSEAGTGNLAAARYDALVREIRLPAGYRLQIRPEHIVSSQAVVLSIELEVAVPGRPTRLFSRQVVVHE